VPVSLLRLEYLFQLAHHRGLDLVQSVHDLFDARPIERVNLQLGFFRLGEKLRIFESADES